MLVLLVVVDPFTDPHYTQFLFKSNTRQVYRSQLVGYNANMDDEQIEHLHKLLEGRKVEVFYKKNTTLIPVVGYGNHEDEPVVWLSSSGLPMCCSLYLCDTHDFRIIPEVPWPSQQLEKLDAIYAWYGEDEFNSGKIGLKQAAVPAGIIPLVAVDLDKINSCHILEQLKTQANAYNKTISLGRFVFEKNVNMIHPDH